MTFKPYSKYKASGIEWLGDVPEGWARRRLRFGVELNPSKSECSDLARETMVSFLPMEAISENGETDLQRERPISEVETGYTYFRNGDVVIAKITPCFENGKGARVAGLTNGIGFGTTELIVTRSNGKTEGRFVQWLFMSQPFRKLGEGHMYGAGGQKRLPDDFVRNFDMAWPSTNEQSAIAVFLDRETAKIDSLIAKQEAMIVLLKEKRQAVISHAVTKGLDPIVPMKPSSVEWLGDVPKHWDVCGFTKYLGPIIDYRGRTPTKIDDGVLLLTARNIKNGRIDYTASQEFISADEYPFVMQRGLPEIDDVLFTMEAPLGQVANIDRTDIALAQRIVKFRGLPGVVDNFYLKYWIMGTGCQCQLEQLGTGSTALGIKSSKLGQIQFCFPTIDEQRNIVTHLDKSTSKIDTLIAKAQQAIVLQKEHRTALISAAVTGKIDVRNEVAERKAA